MSATISDVSMQVLILCAGGARRFNGTLKQLLPMGPETILHRICRQAAMRSKVNPVVVTHKDELKKAWSEWAEPSQREVTCDTFLSTKSLWEDRTVILLGDVIYSKPAMDAIMNCGADVMVFGDKWEVFAVSFSDKPKVEEALEEAKGHWPGKLGQFYCALVKVPFNAKRGLRDQMEDWPHFHYIEDWTRDIDMEGQYHTALKELVTEGLLDEG